MLSSPAPPLHPTLTLYDQNLNCYSNPIWAPCSTPPPPPPPPQPHATQPPTVPPHIAPLSWFHPAVSWGRGPLPTSHHVWECSTFQTQLQGFQSSIKDFVWKVLGSMVARLQCRSWVYLVVYLPRKCTLVCPHTIFPLQRLSPDRCSWLPSQTSSRESDAQRSIVSVNSVYTQWIKLACEQIRPKIALKAAMGRGSKFLYHLAGVNYSGTSVLKPL